MGAEEAAGASRATRSSGRMGAESSSKARGRTRKRARRNRVIESDDDEEMPAAAAAEAPASPGGQPSPPARPGGDPAADPVPPPARTPSPPPPPQSPVLSQPIDMEADISMLEPATFTTIRRGPPEPMLRLNWSHKVNLMAEKVLNPLIYMCEKCDCPVLSYGRMFPCKHVLCFDCAQPLDKCWRCGERAVRVERAGLGKLFMCLHDGKRYDNNGCRRTYLSQRDLQAHITHRHMRAPPPPQPPPPPPPQPVEPPRHSIELKALDRREDSLREDARDDERREERRRELRRDPQRPSDPRLGGFSQSVVQQHRGPSHVSGHRSGHGHAAHHDSAYSPSGNKMSGGSMKQQQIPVISTQRSGNLITIPIQGQEPTPEPPPQQQQQQHQLQPQPAQYATYQHQQYAPAPAAYPQQPEPSAAQSAYYQSTPPPAPAAYGRAFPPPSIPPPSVRPAQFPTTAQPWTVTNPPPISRPPPDRRFYH